MKKALFFFVSMLGAFGGFAQTNILAQDLAEEYNVIVTAVPFLMITPDSRSASMGDVGVATSTDVWSQYSNASKYVFSEKNFGVGLSYVPWMHNLGVTDENILALAGYKKLTDNDALGTSIRYFSMGTAPSYDEEGNYEGYDVSPREYAFDFSYSRRLAECFAMGMTARFIYSDLIGEPNDEMHSGKAVAFDISGMYSKKLNWRTPNSRRTAFSPKKNRYLPPKDIFSAGISISNIGTKVSYSEAGKDFLPTNLKLGCGYVYTIDASNKVNLFIEFNKLLVPTPPQYVYDSNGNVIAIEGKEDDIAVLKGLFQSFYDAPGGFKEEIKEYTISVGTEYWFNDKVVTRLGYFNEAETKGNRKYFTSGLGFKYDKYNVDFSYLIPTNGKKSPLVNTFRCSLEIEFE